MDLEIVIHNTDDDIDFLEELEEIEAAHNSPSTKDDPGKKAIQKPGASLKRRSSLPLPETKNIEKPTSPSLSKTKGNERQTLPSSSSKQKERKKAELDLSCKSKKSEKPVHSSSSKTKGNEKPTTSSSSKSKDHRRDSDKIKNAHHSSRNGNTTGDSGRKSSSNSKDTQKIRNSSSSNNNVENSSNSKTNTTKKSSSSSSVSTGATAKIKSSPTKITTSVSSKNKTVSSSSSNNDCSDKKKNVKLPNSKSNEGVGSETISKENEVNQDNYSINEESYIDIYVSGISQKTKASDLKDLFVKYVDIKIKDAKIIKFNKIPGKCFGKIVVENVNDADKFIAKLDKTKLNGRIISVSKNSPLKDVTGREVDNSPTRSKPKETPQKTGQDSAGDSNSKKEKENLERVKKSDSKVKPGHSTTSQKKSSDDKISSSKPDKSKEKSEKNNEKSEKKDEKSEKKDEKSNTIKNHHSDKIGSFTSKKHDSKTTGPKQTKSIRTKDTIRESRSRDKNFKRFKNRSPRKIWRNSNFPSDRKSPIGFRPIPSLRLSKYQVKKEELKVKNRLTEERLKLERERQAVERERIQLEMYKINLRKQIESQNFAMSMQQEEFRRQNDHGGNGFSKRHFELESYDGGRKRSRSNDRKSYGSPRYRSDVASRDSNLASDSYKRHEYDSNFELEDRRHDRDDRHSSRNSRVLEHDRSGRSSSIGRNEKRARVRSHGDVHSHHLRYGNEMHHHPDAGTGSPNIIPTVGSFVMPTEMATSPMDLWAGAHMVMQAHWDPMAALSPAVINERKWIPEIAPGFVNVQPPSTPTRNSNPMNDVLVQRNFGYSPPPSDDRRSVSAVGFRNGRSNH